MDLMTFVFGGPLMRIRPLVTKKQELLLIAPIQSGERVLFLQAPYMDCSGWKPLRTFRSLDSSTTQRLASTLAMAEESLILMVLICKATLLAALSIPTPLLMLLVDNWPKLSIGTSSSAAASSA